MLSKNTYVCIWVVDGSIRIFNSVVGCQCGVETLNVIDVRGKRGDEYS